MSSQHELCPDRDGISGAVFALDDDEAVFYGIVTTVMNSVRLAKISLGEIVIIFGLGLLGQLAAQLVRLNGSFPVIAVDVAEKRLFLLREREKSCPNPFIPADT